jgi:hypothetical protein
MRFFGNGSLTAQSLRLGVHSSMNRYLYSGGLPLKTASWGIGKIVP